jgi:signal transduction histidine kinase
METRYPPAPDASSGVGNVLRTGQPELYPEISEFLLLAAAIDEEHRKYIRNLGMKSAMLVPMVARGRTLGVISFVSAESGRRYGSEDLALAQHLARRAALAVDNARLYREAQEAIRVRNELFSSVSHDLKNPITGMKGMAQLLGRQLARLDVQGKERILEGLASIDATATRMTAQLDELLDLARLQSGQAPLLNRRLIDLVSLAREAAHEQERTTERHRITVKAEVPELLGRWDPLRLGRVVTNLISNAIKYSPRGGEVEVTVHEETTEEGSWAVLDVRDHGIGIPAADLDRVFESFQRGGNVEGRIAGTGLGLTSVRQIVELHGGTIGVASREGEGSTFSIRLPLEPAQGAGKAA